MGGRGGANRLAMTKPLSQDLRRRIARAVEKGSSIRQAAAQYEVSPLAAVKLMRRLHESGSVTSDRIGGHRRAVLEPQQETGETPPQTAWCPKKLSHCLQRSSSLSSEEARCAC
jgi:transposase